MAKKQQQHRTHQEFLETVKRKKDKKRFCDYNGNTGKAQLPLSKRCENLLINITAYGETGICQHYLDDKVVQKLLDNGDVYLYHWCLGSPSSSITKIVASKFPQPSREEREQRNAELKFSRLANIAIEEEQGPKKTVKWTKERHQKLLMDALMGKADKEIVEQVTKTKTLPKKVVVDPNKYK